MAISHDVESYVQAFEKEFCRWQGRIENLKRMAGPVADESRAQMDAAVQRIEAILKDARDALQDADAMTTEQWMAVHPKVSAALRAMQSCYNNIVSDWPQL
jgi:hypothetical protein